MIYNKLIFTKVDDPLTTLTHNLQTMSRQHCYYGQFIMKLHLRSKFEFNMYQWCMCLLLGWGAAWAGFGRDRERDNILHHLAVNAVQALVPPWQITRDVFLSECLLQLLLGRNDGHLIIRLHKLRWDFIVLLRIEVLEAQVLQLLLPAWDPKPICQGSKYLQCLLGKPLLLGPGESTKCHHVMEPISQLDQDSSCICHCEEHGV